MVIKHIIKISLEKTRSQKFVRIRDNGAGTLRQVDGNQARGNHIKKFTINIYLLHFSNVTQETNQILYNLTHKI